MAQEADMGVAQYLPLKGDNIRAGSIVSSSTEGFVLSTKPYDQTVIGVVSDKPAISFDIFQLGAGEKRYQVLTAGTVRVNVSSINGTIKKGDLVTSSSIQGVGMRASKTGFILGTSLAEMSAKDVKEIRKVPIFLSLRSVASQSSAKTRIIDVGNLSALALIEDPLTALRYILAALVLLLSFVLGFFAFGRVASRGVEAIGRNPLAARMIQLGVALNVLVTVAIIGAGIVVAILILTI